MLITLLDPCPHMVIEINEKKKKELNAFYDNNDKTKQKKKKEIKNQIKSLSFQISILFRDKLVTHYMFPLSLLLSPLNNENPWLKTPEKSAPDRYCIYPQILKISPKYQ